jgi:D-alanine-D-alanine ligase-like ATP-grasp enzyme
MIEDKKRVGILRGGTGDYYETSLKEGGHVISHILDLSDKWKPVDILIDKEGIWHAGGVPIKPSDLINKVDVVWNSTHPSFSNVLKNLSIPTTGVSSFSFASNSSRAILEEHMKKIGVSIPKHIIIPLYQEDFDGPVEKYVLRKAKAVFEKFSSPWVVKSFASDLDMGVHIAKTFVELTDAIMDGVKHKKSILVEELIAGKDVSMHSVAGFRGEDIYTFLPGNFSLIEKEKLTNLTKDIYNHLGVSNYLKADFILSSNGRIYLNNVEFSPNLKEDSHFCESCESVGAKSHHIIEHILERALNGA